MTGGRFTTTIDAPIERVWAVVGDLNTHASWSPKPYEMEWTSGEPNQLGSRLHSVGSVPGASHNQNDTEITERVEPTRLVLRANDPQGVFVNEYDLRAIDDRTTEVAYTITFPKLHGMAAVLGPVAFPLVGKPDIRKRLELLKRKVENETQP
jgi:uncharacterized protein YndB with AHSA1/START domain